MDDIHTGAGEAVNRRGADAEFPPLLKSMKGYKTAVFVGDDAVGEYAAMSVWESKEDADAALAATEVQLKERLTGIAQGPPTRKVYEVWGVLEAD